MRLEILIEVRQNGLERYKDRSNSYLGSAYEGNSDNLILNRNSMFRFTKSAIIGQKFENQRAPGDFGSFRNKNITNKICCRSDIARPTRKRSEVC